MKGNEWDLLISKCTIVSIVIRYLIDLIISLLVLLKRELIIKAIKTKGCKGGSRG